MPEEPPLVLEFGMGVDVQGRDCTKAELPHGEVSVRAVSGGLLVPNSDAIIACASITVRARYPA